jgi:hypothetical protein
MTAILLSISPKREEKRISNSFRTLFKAIKYKLMTLRNKKTNSTMSPRHLRKWRINWLLWSISDPKKNWAHKHHSHLPEIINSVFSRAINILHQKQFWINMDRTRCLTAHLIKNKFKVLEKLW